LNPSLLQNPFIFHVHANALNSSVEINTTKSSTFFVKVGGNFWKLFCNFLYLLRVKSILSEFLATDPEVPGSIPRSYQIFLQVGGLERGPLSLVITTEEVLEKRSSGFGLENRD
jgi:hypothetical protein